MRILDEKGNEILEPDLELGHLVSDTLIKKHKAEPEIPMQTKRELVWEDPDDPKNVLYKVVVIQEYIPAKPAWDEAERIQRYIPYTPEELAKREADKLAAEEARKEAEAEAQRQAEFREKLKALPEQVESLEEAAAELGGVIGENDAILTQVQSDISDVMEAVAELGTLIVGEE